MKPAPSEREHLTRELAEVFSDIGSEAFGRYALDFYDDDPGEAQKTEADIRREEFRLGVQKLGTISRKTS